MSIEDRLKSLAITLPSAPAPIAAYVPSVQSGDLLFVSGQGPVLGGEWKYKGKLGRDVTIEQGYEAAKLAILNALSVAKATLGSLDRIERVVRVTGYVNSTDNFDQQPKVVNGASETLVKIFGDSGKHARVAVGVNALPMGIAVEIEVVFRVKH